MTEKLLGSFIHMQPINIYQYLPNGFMDTKITEYVSGDPDDLTEFLGADKIRRK